MAVSSTQLLRVIQQFRRYYDRHFSELLSRTGLSMREIHVVLFLANHPLSRLVLWTYYSQLFLCGMNWDKETRITEMYWIEPAWGSFALLTAGFLLTLWIGWRLLERKEC